MHGQNFHVMHSLFPGMHANMSHVINQLSFGQTYPGQVTAHAWTRIHGPYMDAMHTWVHG